MEEKDTKLDDSTKKFLYWFFAVILFITIIGLIANKGNNDTKPTSIIENNTSNQTDTAENTISNEDTKKVTVPDFKDMSKDEIKNWCNSNNIEYDFDEEYSNEIEKGKFISQSIAPNNIIDEDDELTIIYSLGKKPTVIVPDFSKMSKKEAKKWGNKNKIDINVEEDYSSKVQKGKFIKQSIKAKKKIEIDGEITVTYSLGRKPTLGDENALQKAYSYLDSMSFSYKSLIEQLEYEGFSKSEATYGADNCGADWNEQAAKKAESYMDSMSFSKSGLISQLEYEGFTKKQAQYGAKSVGY